MKKEILTKTQVRIEVPSIPNFIRINGTGVPIAKITDKNLKELGKIWTKELIALAKKRRQSQEI